MSTAKIIVSIDDKHLEHSRLARECDKLDVEIEQEMADMGLDEDVASWPKY